MNTEPDVKTTIIDVTHLSNLNVTSHKWSSFYKDEDEMFIFYATSVFKVEWNTLW